MLILLLFHNVDQRHATVNVSSVVMTTIRIRELLLSREALNSNDYENEVIKKNKIKTEKIKLFNSLAGRQCVFTNPID